MHVLQVERDVAALHPNPFEQHPQVLFQLRQQRFKKLTAQGELAAAIAFARSSLAPLAQAHAELLPLLKVSMHEVCTAQVSPMYKHLSSPHANKRDVPTYIAYAI